MVASPAHIYQKDNSLPAVYIYPGAGRRRGKIQRLARVSRVSSLMAPIRCV